MSELLSESLSSYVDDPCLQGLIEQYGENLEHMERYKKFIIAATITTHFACMYTGYVLDKGNLSEVYWQNNILFGIADWTPVSVRSHFDELGQIDEQKLLKLCEFLMADLISTKEAE